jgi:hypothetical protein
MERTDSASPPSRTVGLFGDHRMAFQEPLEGIHDLAPFDVGLGAINMLPHGIAAQEKPLAKALAITSASIFTLGSSSCQLESNL